jgi:hypothetical protein
LLDMCQSSSLYCVWVLPRPAGYFSFGQRVWTTGRLNLSANSSPFHHNQRHYHSGSVSDTTYPKPTVFPFIRRIEAVTPLSSTPSFPVFDILSASVVARGPDIFLTGLCSISRLYFPQLALGARPKTSPKMVSPSGEYRRLYGSQVPPDYHEIRWYPSDFPIQFLCRLHFSTSILSNS